MRLMCCILPHLTYLYIHMYMTHIWHFYIDKENVITRYIFMVFTEFLRRLVTVPNQNAQLNLLGWTENTY